MRLINKTNLLVTLFILTLLSCKNNFNINYTDINKKTAQESLNPIRPGIPDKVPFWNKYSLQFIYAPSFDVSPIKYAVEYKFTAMACDSTEYTFNSDKPYEKLSSIWDKIPVGFVKLNICGINKLGTQIGNPYTFSFYKAASFKGPYHEKVSDYKISAERALEYEFKQDYIQNWAINGTPDTASYNLYCYPSKIIGAVVETMLEYSKISEPNKEKALKIAINAADYLINISEKKGTPLEFFPPTYAGKQRTAKAFRNQFMTIYPAHTACTYLDLYDTTNRIDYKEAALNIAGTYKKLQQASGTWKLKLWSDGSPVVNNDCIPIEIIKFLDRLESQYKIKEYTDVRNQAYNWIINNALKTYNWSGQFEDVAPIEPYKNLSKDEASAFAKYLFEKKNQDKEFIKLADDLLRFCEDQFIIWEKPMPREQYNVAEWITPCVLEQYACYEPIIASTANMIDAYSAGYKATKNDIYRAKAIELANTVTVSQHADTGRYPTYWQLNERQNKESGYIDWLNCTGYCAKIMLEISAFDEMNICKNF